MELLHVSLAKCYLSQTVDSVSSEGRARVTIFAAQSNARTFDYSPGDVGTTNSCLVFCAGC